MYLLLLYGIIIINFILALAIVFFQRRDPKTVWAWLLLLGFLPLAGFILYLFVGRNFYCERAFHNKELEDKRQMEACRQEDYIAKNTFETSVFEEEYKDYVNLIMLNLRAGNSFYTENNRVEIYSDGNMKFDGLIDAIRVAEKFIFMQYYIIREDILFERVCRHLRQKIKEGVKVYILADGVGSGRLSEKRIRMLREEGFNICKFFPPVFKKFGFSLLNYRNHRKIAVIDGKVGWIGGFNIGKEYLGINKKYGYWRDTHLKIEGGAVAELMIRILQDWNYAAKNKEDKLECREYIDGLNRIFGSFNERGVGMQIISSGPDSKTEQIRDNYLYMIHHAKKNIYIQTPYFIPDEAVLYALRMAALSNVEVKIMIPCKPDHPFVYWATHSYVGDLLHYGVKCYLYQKGFLHAKTIMVDGIISSVGTANMDLRSFRLNFEVNAVIYDRETTRELEDIFLKDIGDSVELTSYDYGQRSLKIRVKEQASRLLSPLL